MKGWPNSEVVVVVVITVVLLTLIIFSSINTEIVGNN